MTTSSRSGLRFSLVSMDVVRDPAWGNWPSVDLPDEIRADDAKAAVRIADFDGGGVYVARLARRKPTQVPALSALWRAPLDQSRSLADVRWRSDAEIAARAEQFLRRCHEWLLAKEGSDPVRRGLLQRAEQHDLDNAKQTPEEVAVQVRVARASGIPIALSFTAAYGHPWALSERTASRLIADARAKGLLPEETGRRGPGRRSAAKARVEEQK